ncbi:MAG: DUF262 domain-containing protein [Burkholderiales bacterium]|nr:DUF262 domain-containing protein [Burkholderiales bacterium]
MDPERIVIHKCSVAQLLRDTGSGKFAIPHLQREFVWDGPKAAKLLDSIFRGMPVGVVLIWQTPKDQRLHLREKFHVLPPFNSHNRKVWFLIDGQQRVSVLHHVCKGDRLENARRQPIDFSRVVFALKNKVDGQYIRYRRPVTREYISMSDVLHPQWRQKLNGFGKREVERVRDCRNRILNYRMFQMFIESDIADIRECFLRINTQGMKVTTADAVFTQAESLKLRDIVHELRQHLDDRFNDIGEQPLLFLLAAVRGASEARGRVVADIIRKLNRDALKDIQLRKSLAKDWNRLGPCIGKAADYLRDKFFVVSRDFLASDYMLAMLAFFYFHNVRGPNPKQAAEIRKWFWATSVGSRYSGRDFNRCVPQDLKQFLALSKNPSKRFAYSPQAETIDIRKAQFGAKSAITSAVYCMLLKRGPVYLLSEGLDEIPIHHYSTRANRSDRHHIFPRQPMANEGIPASLYNSISNICMLVAEENQKIGSMRPRVYLQQLDQPGTGFNRKMDRHLIPIDESSGVWEKNIKRGFKAFLTRRTSMICTALEIEAGIRLFRRDLPRI